MMAASQHMKLIYLVLMATGSGNNNYNTYNMAP